MVMNQKGQFFTGEKFLKLIDNSSHYLKGIRIELDEKNN